MAHSSRDQLKHNLDSLPIRPGQRYQHYKTQGIYVIDKLVMLEASEEAGVAYYDENYPDLVWVRTYQDFTAKVGHQPRFSLLS